MEPASWVSLAKRAVQKHRGRCKRCSDGKGRCAQLHQDVAADLACDLRFPVRTQFRGYIVRRRMLAVKAGVPNAAWAEGQHEVVEVIPEGYGEAAYEALGGVLLHAEGPLDLMPASVLMLTAEVLSPTTYTLYPYGLLAQCVQATVEVAVRA